LRIEEQEIKEKKGEDCEAGKYRREKTEEQG
jgi:hypothetical protein